MRRLARQPEYRKRERAAEIKWDASGLCEQRELTFQMLCKCHRRCPPRHLAVLGLPFPSASFPSEVSLSATGRGVTLVVCAFIQVNCESSALWGYRNAEGFIGQPMF